MSITTTINGLLSQKPTSAKPQPGEQRWFSWMEKTGRSGKPYIKIKNDDEEHGGRLCEVISSEQTDFVDAHQNISFNVEFTPLDGAKPQNGFQQAKATMQQDALPMRQDAPKHNLPAYYGKDAGIDARQRAIIRQHSQAMALEVLTLKGQLGQLGVEDLSPEKITALSDYFDADVLGQTE